MDPTISVAKGCFVFKNGATRANKSAKKSTTKRKKISASSSAIVGSSAIGADLARQPFYQTYKETWTELEENIERLQHKNYILTLDSLVNDIVRTDGKDDGLCSYAEILPTAALLTGINQPDHFQQFETLSERIMEKMSASVCILESRDCATIKSTIETLVHAFLESSTDDDDDRDHKRMRKSQCTMKLLKEWYQNNYGLETEGGNLTEDSDESDVASSSGNRHSLIVILSDFECFSTVVLQDLIMILSSYCEEMRFVLILGVATGVTAVHNTLPYHVMSKIKLRVYEMQSAPDMLNELLHNVVLSTKNTFHLSGKVCKFLTHIFLYYDFSIIGFIQALKKCIFEHYFQGNAFSLCSGYAASLTKLKLLTHEDMESIRQLMSFRPYVESINDCKRIISILTDDNYLKKKLPQLLRDCHVHFILFRVFLEFLAALISDLPKAPLGKHVRELYSLCLTREITAEVEFKECWQVLHFMSKDAFVTKISQAVKNTQAYVIKEVNELELANDCIATINEKLDTVKKLMTKVVMAGVEVESPTKTSNTPENLQHFSSRQELKERLLQLTKQSKPTSEYTSSVEEILSFIHKEIVESCLVPLKRAPPLYELFVFSDIGTVRRNFIGAPRAALHMALNNPHYYMQCKCCQLKENTQLLATLPDLSIVYKLHLECGRMINLFDWLQAFRAIVEDVEIEDQSDEVNPQIQARFTRAVAELQFLGYIKMSKRKMDHAQRLTW